MTVIKNENFRPFDVDNCLIVHKDKSLMHAYVLDPVTGTNITVGVNEAMVRLLKEERQRGSYVVVWSRSGYEWAANVVRALYLEDCVDCVVSKPTIYFDDTPVKKWLKDRVFLGPDVQYKR